MRGLIILIALLGAVGVAIGAFAAHGLEKQLAGQGLEPADVLKRMDQCDVAVRYHMLHTLAMLAVTLVQLFSGKRSTVAGVAAFFWLLGIGLFSGGLYSMVFAGVMGHWAIVPSGGLCFILGWFSLAGAGFSVPAGSASSERTAK